MGAFPLAIVPVEKDRIHTLVAAAPQEMRGHPSLYRIVERGLLASTEDVEVFCATLVEHGTGPAHALRLCEREGLTLDEVYAILEVRTMLKMEDTVRRKKKVGGVFQWVSEKALKTNITYGQILFFYRELNMNLEDVPASVQTIVNLTPARGKFADNPHALQAFAISRAITLARDNNITDIEDLVVFLEGEQEAFFRE